MLVHTNFLSFNLQIVSKCLQDGINYSILFGTIGNSDF